MHRPSASAWLYGFLGMAIFSASLPATRLAVANLDPFFVTAARAAIAGAIGGVLLFAFRVPRPRGADWGSLLVIAAGVVVGFPLLSGMAMQRITSAEGLVFMALLPLATAVIAVWRTGDRPRPLFWLFAAAGSACISVYAASNGAKGSLGGDALMVGSIVSAGFGYAEGVRLTRRIGGWQTICWALLLSLPLTVAYSAVDWPDWSRVSASGYAGFAYVSLFSMLLGFFFWYRGLAEGGVAAIGQLQLLQPFLGLALAASLLGEHVGWDMALAASAVIASIAGSRRYAHGPARIEVR